MKRMTFERVNRRWNQRDLAKQTGIHSTYISCFESGRMNPTTTELAKLSSALGVPGDRLFEEVVLADSVAQEVAAR